MHAVSEIPSLPSVRGVVGAALRREWLSHRLNRFLYSHVALVLVGVGVGVASIPVGGATMGVGGAVGFIAGANLMATGTRNIYDNYKYIQDNGWRAFAQLNNN